MILYVDTEKKQLVQSLTSNKTIGTPEFMQGDNEPLEIHLLESGDDKAIYYDKIFSEGVDFIKVAIARFDVTPTILTFSETITERIKTGGINVMLPLNTTNIETAVGEKKYIDAYLEIEYSNANGKIRTVLQTTCRVRNDLIENAPTIELQDEYYTKEFIESVFARKAKDYAFIITEPPSEMTSFSDAVIEVRDGKNLLYKTSTLPTCITNLTDTDEDKIDLTSEIYFSATGIIGKNYFDFLPYFRDIFGSIYREAWILQDKHRTSNAVKGVYIKPNPLGLLPDGTSISSVINETKPYTAICRKFHSFCGESNKDNPVWSTCRLDSFSACPTNISELIPTWTNRTFNNLQSAEEYGLGVNIPSNSYALILFEAYPYMTPSVSNVDHKISFEDLILDEHGSLISEQYQVAFTPSGLTDEQLTEYYPTAYWSRYHWDEEMEKLETIDYGLCTPTGIQLFPDFYDILEGSDPVLHLPSDFSIELKAETGSFEVVRFDDYYRSKGEKYNPETNEYEEIFNPHASLIRDTPAESGTEGEVIGVSFDVKLNSIYDEGDDAESSIRQPFAIIKTGEESVTLKLCVPQGATGRILGLKILNWEAQENEN